MTGLHCLILMYKQHLANLQNKRYVYLGIIQKTHAGFGEENQFV